MNILSLNQARVINIANLVWEFFMLLMFAFGTFCLVHFLVFLVSSEMKHNHYFMNSSELCPHLLCFLTCFNHFVHQTALGIIWINLWISSSFFLSFFFSQISSTISIRKVHNPSIKDYGAFFFLMTTQPFDIFDLWIILIGEK